MTDRHRPQPRDARRVTITFPTPPHRTLPEYYLTSLLYACTPTSLSIHLISLFCCMRVCACTRVRVSLHVTPWCTRIMGFSIVIITNCI